MLDSQRAQVRLLWRARGGEHFGTRRLRELDCRQSHAARSRMNQHAVTRLQLRQVVRQRDGDKDRRHCGKLGGRYVRRRVRDQFLVHHRFRAESAKRQRDNAVAYGYVRYVRADFNDVTAQLFAEQPLLNESERTEYTQEIQPGSVHRHADLPRLQ